jgi:hypothetical protein
MARRTFQQKIAGADEVPREPSDAVRALFQRPPTGEGRRNPIRPAEKRRRKRKLTVTFSYDVADYPERLRALARRWGWFSNNGRPNSSAVVEFLIGKTLEAAECGNGCPTPGRVIRP